MSDEQSDKQVPYAVGDYMYIDEGQSIRDYLNNPDEFCKGRITKVISHTTYTYVLDWEDEEMEDDFEYGHEKLIPSPTQ
jgi:hypothetical protein